MFVCALKDLWKYELFSKHEQLPTDHYDHTDRQTRNYKQNQKAAIQIATMTTKPLDWKELVIIVQTELKLIYLTVDNNDR